MAKIDDLKAQAALIENETAIGGNTAQRVGGTFGTAAELIEGNANEIINLSQQKASVGKVSDIDFEIGSSAGDYTYNANAGLIYGESGVSKANSSYNGVVLRLAKNTRYTITGTYVSVIRFNAFPKVGDSSSDVVGRNFTQEVEGQYLLITLRLREATNIVVTNSGYGIVNDIDNLKEVIMPQKSRLFGKTIVCFGDSITEFVGLDGKRYTDWMAEITGANVINVGIGGTSFAQRTQPVITPTTFSEGYAGLDIISMVRAACGVMFDESTPFGTVVTNAAVYIKDTEKDDNTDIVTRLLAIEWDKVDAVTFFAGTNDWNNRVGHWGVSGSMDVNTTLGAINEIIRLMLSTYKHLKIYWFTPTVRWLNYNEGQSSDGDWSDVKIKGEGESARTLKEFSMDIENEVKLNHIPICDLYNTLGINKYNFSNYFTDGTHPRKGFDMLAKRIASFIESNLSF